MPKCRRNSRCDTEMPVLASWEFDRSRQRELEAGQHVDAPGCFAFCCFAPPALAHAASIRRAEHSWTKPQSESCDDSAAAVRHARVACVLFLFLPEVGGISLVPMRACKARYPFGVEGRRLAHDSRYVSELFALILHRASSKYRRGARPRQQDCSLGCGVWTAQSDESRLARAPVADAATRARTAARLGRRRQCGGWSVAQLAS